MQWMLLIIISLTTNAAVSSILTNSTTEDLLDIHVSMPEQNDRGGDRCLDYLHTSLDKLRRRQVAGRAATIDLSGYALHQTLRNAPVDMYVTDIKVRAPSVGSWAHVARCQLLPRGEINAQVTFSDLVVSGVIRLLEGGLESIKTPPPLCNMVLRLRRAGLDLKAIPALGIRRNSQTGRNPEIQVRTEANFLEPQFVSVHAHGCQLDQWAKEHSFSFDESVEHFQRNLDDTFPIRIISLKGETKLDDILEDNLEVRDLYKQRILNQNLQPLNGFIKMKKKIQQQSNSVFQTNGPLSENHSQPTTSRTLGLKKPIFTPNIQTVSSITELDSKLQPIKTVPQKPYHNIFPQPTSAHLTEQSALYEVHSEMEDVFLRGTKALITKYLEKQLEVPLKEALMTSIGYTVSYG